ncbi:tectonin domain-containing protein [Gracilimonas sp.]|uniref:tectonin domain-containing protein n=1 Tax=Gracilimonas sp. TaxID=1974203 RepID=UPI003BAB5AC7
MKNLILNLKIHVIAALLAVLFSAPITEAAEITTTDEDVQFVEQQIIDLRLHHFLEINEAEKVNDRLYKVNLSGMGAKVEESLLYKGTKGSWILIIKTGPSYHEFLKINDPVYFFTTQNAIIQLDNTTPTMVRSFLSSYTELGSSISLKAGASFAGIWNPNEVEADVEELIKLIGLDKIGSGNSSGFHNGLKVTGSYNYLASNNAIMSIVTSLGTLPTIPGQPDAFKMEQQSVDLGIQCRLTASFDFIKPKSFAKFDETDCELKLETEVRIDINSDHIFFDAAVGFRSIKRANSLAANEEVAKRAKMLGFDPNKSVAAFIEGDVRGGVWKDIFGLKGFTMQEVKLQTLINKETGWHIGVFGQIDFGSETRLTAAALIPVGATGDSFSDVALEASLDRISLEELAMLPFVLEGSAPFSKELQDEVRKIGLNQFALQNAKFTFAPSISDPDLGIDQSGTTVTGTLIAFNKILGSLKVYINQDGMYFDDVIEPFEIGWVELKDARFKGFIPSKKQKNKEGGERERNLKDYVIQNALVLYFDTSIEIDGNEQKAFVSFSPLKAGIEFDVNLTEEFAMGFKLMLPLGNILDAQWPFDVSAHLHDGTEGFSKEIRSMISEGIKKDIENTDKTYQSEIDAITDAQNNLDFLKKKYEDARAVAQAREDKALAPLKKAEALLDKTNSHSDYLYGEFKHWKSKAKHTSWLHPKDKIHDYWEEGKYWAEYEAYKAEVSAAKLIVKSLEATTEFIAVDADPDVIASFSAYNGGRFTLAIAKGALTAAKKANDYVGNLVEDVLDSSFDELTIKDVSVSGTSASSGKFDLTFTISGSLYGQDWDINTAATLSSPKESGQFIIGLIKQGEDDLESAAKSGAENLKMLAESFSPMSQSLVAHSKSKFHGANYAQYPKGATLAYAWEKIDGNAVDIATGKDIVFVNNEGGQVFYRTKAENKWVKMDEASGVERLSVINEDVPVVINRGGGLFYYDKASKKWTKDPHASSVMDVGANAKGDIWVINENNNIFRRKTNGTWEEMPGQAIRIDVDDTGVAWVLNKTGGIFRWNENDWEKIEGEANDIGAGGKNTWVVNINDNVFHFIPGTKSWVKITGLGKNIAVDQEGTLWLVNKNGSIFINKGPR